MTLELPFLKAIGTSFTYKSVMLLEAFFQEGKVLKQINPTLIALILKVSNPGTTNHFRPISLSNNFYEMITKILVNKNEANLELNY